MTKRFDYTAYDDGTESIYDRKKDEYYFDMQLSEIEELMNELADENERLKHECGLYCYMVSFYNYSDSEFIPIFHEKRFTKQEFQEICNEIKKKILGNKENKWDWEYPSTFVEYAKEYGFKDIDVLEVETIGFKVTTYGCVE